MPNIKIYDVRVDIDTDIDVEDFVDECSETEMKNLIKYLIEQEYLINTSIVKEDQLTYDQEQFYNLLKKLTDSYFTMSQKDRNILENIAKKY